MKLSEFKIFLSVKSYDEKNAETYRNDYVVEKHIVSKLSKLSIPNFGTQIEDLNKIVSKFRVLVFNDHWEIDCQKA